MMKKQQGVALVLGLVVLMVLTIMGVSSMSNTTLQLQVSKNTMEHSQAFQASLSCIEESIRAADLSKPTDVIQSFTCSTLNSGKSDLKYVGCKRAFGGSLERGARMYIYETESTGYSAGGGARSIISAAVGKLVAAEDCDDVVP